MKNKTIAVTHNYGVIQFYTGKLVNNYDFNVYTLLFWNTILYCNIKLKISYIQIGSAMGKSTMPYFFFVYYGSLFRGRS